MNKTLKRILIVLLILVLVLAVLAGGYLIYFFSSYHRIPDNTPLEVFNTGSNGPVQVDTGYTITTFNIGFGAYSSDYSFFMDGGTESWAFSKQAVLDNTNGVLATIEAQKPDFCLFQEVDLNSTRSYHVDQTAMLFDAMPDMDHVVSIDFDSPFLFYPFTQPHGRCLSSIVTLARFRMNSSVRRSLPIDQGFSKYTDLDRCFSVTEFDVSNGKKLYLYNVHLSAYSDEPGTVESQVRELSDDIAQHYADGNYIIVGGDFNQDMLDTSAEIFGTTESYSWTKPFNASLLPDYCHIVLPTDETNIIPSCRLADKPYVKGESFVITIDGFLVSDNIAVSELQTIDAGFANSDHNPVRMQFTLNG